MNRLFFAFLLLYLGLVSGCSLLRTSEQPSGINLPEQWSKSTSALVQQPVAWWKNFNDPQLDSLIEQSLSKNNDFKAATLRVRRAQLQAAQVDTNLTPSVAIGGSSGFFRTFNPRDTTRTIGASASVSYELDFWGKLALQREAAELEVAATDADCQVFALSTVSTTARLYWQIAYLNQLLSLSRTDIESAEKILTLTKVKYETGAVGELNKVLAELNLYNQQAFYTQLMQQRVEARHAFAIMFDQPPNSSVFEPMALQEVALPTVAAGIPAEILANRPDLRSAELRLRATLLNVDITRTAFYPTFSLTATLGATSFALENLARDAVASLGASLALPFVQWNSMSLAIGVSKAQYEEAVINFRQRLYIALAEVEDALSARTQLIEEESKLGLVRARTKRAETIAHTRFVEGITDIQVWLNAQASLRGAERSVMTNRLNQLNNQVNIYKTLGLGTTSSSFTCR